MHRAILKNSYCFRWKNSLRLAKESNIQYIPFLVISCGVYSCPLKEASKVAISSVKEFYDDFKELRSLRTCSQAAHKKLPRAGIPATQLEHSWQHLAQNLPAPHSTWWTGKNSFLASILGGTCLLKSPESIGFNNTKNGRRFNQFELLNPFLRIIVALNCYVCGDLTMIVQLNHTFDFQTLFFKIQFVVMYNFNFLD